jgi:hypothetical protein
VLASPVVVAGERIFHPLPKMPARPARDTVDEVHDQVDLSMSFITTMSKGVVVVPPQMYRVCAHLRQRYLMRAPGALDRQAVNLLRPPSSLSACAARSSASSGRTHARARAGPATTAGPRLVLNAPDPRNRGVQRRCHLQMRNLVAFARHVHRLLAVAAQKRVKLVLGQRCQHGWVDETPIKTPLRRVDALRGRARVESPK